MNFKKSILPIVFSLGLTTACTSNFDEINQSPLELSDEELLAGNSHIKGYYPQMQRSIYYHLSNVTWQFQLQQNLIGDIYSGYMMPPTPFAGNVNNMTYALVDGWNAFPFNLAYSNVMGPVKKVQDAVEVDGKIEAPEFYAVNLILKVSSMHRVTDIYGPIPYTKFGEGDAFGAAYDAQEVVYNAFFEELSQASDLLTGAAPISDFTEIDEVFGGDFELWRQYANSLKLRLAMRISNVNSSKAKTMAEEAIQAGVLPPSTVAAVGSQGITHPLFTISNAWDDIRMGANMEVVLKGFNDPRLQIYFTPSEFDGEYRGIRQGIDIKEKDTYKGFSKMSNNIIGETKPLQLMTGAEVAFLKAEAALLGWDAGGTAQALYEEGIAASFTQHNAPLGDYLMGETTPIAYDDPISDDNDIEAQSSVVVAWNDAASTAVKLEQIITQKWIAMFPEGQEAWAEHRRTDFPKLLPVKQNLSNGNIPEGTFIKRVNFPITEYETNTEGVNGGVELLGGPDVGGTALWWDVN